jgi:hypothetical protein
VVFIGRNEDSGTRILTFGESQGGGISGAWDFGQACTQLMIQEGGLSSNSNYSGGYPISNTASISVGSAVTGMQLWPSNWPLNTEPSMNWNLAGHSGYTGGGDVAKNLETPNPVDTGTMPGIDPSTGIPSSGAEVFIVSCLGTSDAATAIGGHGTGLSYNGVPFSTTNVSTGLYSAFNFEHCYYLTSASGLQVAIGANKGAADALADQIWGTPTSTLQAVGDNVGDFNANGLARAFPAGSQIQ